MNYEPLEIFAVVNIALLIYLLSIRVIGWELLRIMIWCVAVSLLVPVPGLFAKAALVAATALLVGRELVIVRTGVLDVLLLNAIALVAARDNIWLAWFLNPVIVFFPNTEFVRTWVQSAIVLWPSLLVIVMLFRRSDDARLRWLLTAWVQAAYVVLLVTAMPMAADTTGKWTGDRFAPLSMAYVAIHVALLAGNAILPWVFASLRESHKVAVTGGKKIRSWLLRALVRIGYRFAAVDAAAFQASRFDVGIMSPWVALAALAMCLAVSVGVVHRFGQSLWISTGLLAVPALIDAIIQHYRSRRTMPVANHDGDISSAVQTGYETHLVTSKLIEPAGALLALFAYAAYCTMSYRWDYEETVLSGSRLLQLNQWLHFLLGAFVLCLLVRLIAGVFDALRLRRKLVPIGLLYVVAPCVVVIYGFWYWLAPPARPHVAANDNQTMLRGRVYLWSGSSRISLLPHQRAAYYETRTNSGYFRQRVCQDAGKAVLVGVRALDALRVECEWDRPPFAVSRSRFGEYRFFDRSWHYFTPSPNPTFDVLTGQELHQLRDEAAFEVKCRLAMVPEPAVVCGKEKMLLPLTGGPHSVPQYPGQTGQAIYAWHFDDSARYQYITAASTVLCLPATVEAQLPLEPRARLPALVLVAMRGNFMQRVHVVYEDEVSCRRLRSTEEGERFYYEWGDLAARRYGSTYVQLFTH